MSHMFKVLLNPESQGGGGGWGGQEEGEAPRWRTAALLRSNMCGGPKRRGDFRAGPVREEALVGSRLLAGPFEAGQISNTALATSLA